MYLTIFGGVHPINIRANNATRRAVGQALYIIIYSLGRGRRRDINYTLKPIFLRAFPF